MQPSLLPLFPLNVVLFPGAPLPLHIFEDRYKEMIGEAVRDKTEFGVVLATDKGIANTGCTAALDRVLRQYPDGRMDILTGGRRRFEINLLNDERSFLRGDVFFFDDEDDDRGPADLRRIVAEAGRQLDREAAVDDSDPKLSFTVAQRLPDLEVKQLLLSIRSEGERIRQLAQLAPAIASRQKMIDHVRGIASRNGHSHHILEGE